MVRGDSSRELVTKAADSLRQGRIADARELSERARAAAPDDPEVLKRLADIAFVLQDLPLAAELLAEAIAHHAPPAPWRWYHALGETQAVLGKLDQAIVAFRAALAQSSDAVETWRWLGRVLRKVGDVNGAILALRRLRLLSPDEWEVCNDLGGALLEARAFDEAAALFDEATQRGPSQPIVTVNRARLDARRGRGVEAIATLEACLVRNPDYAPAQILLASLLRDERRFAPAAEILRQVAVRSSADASVACGLSRVLLESGAAAEALSVTQAFLRRCPGNSGALAVEALAHLALGHTERAGLLLDYERLVSSRVLAVPSGFSDLATFNRELAAHAATHPTLLMAPPGHATADGFHSGSLLIEPSAPVIALQEALRSAVAIYFRGISALTEHPFVASRPASAFFDVWCVVLPRGGHQVPHIHPEAWLSGVYYAQVPEAMREADGEQGWLSFGEPDRPFPSLLEPRVVRVRPDEGLLVLFPSYFYHRTIPFETDGTRISIAFDLVPNPA